MRPGFLGPGSEADLDSDRRAVACSGVGAFPVVSGLDVVHDTRPGGTPTREGLVLVDLGLQMREKVFSYGVDAPIVVNPW